MVGQLIVRGGNKYAIAAVCTCEQDAKKLCHGHPELKWTFVNGHPTVIKMQSPDEPLVPDYFFR